MATLHLTPKKEENFDAKIEGSTSDQSIHTHTRQKPGKDSLQALEQVPTRRCQEEEGKTSR
jgi:hypothetical protein